MASVSIVSLVMFLALGTAMSTAQLAPSLGNATGFALLSIEGLTLTTSHVVGDVGGKIVSVPSPSTVNGTIYMQGDVEYDAALLSFADAYDEISAMDCRNATVLETNTFAGLFLAPASTVCSQVLKLPRESLRSKAIQAMFGYSKCKAPSLARLSLSFLKAMNPAAIISSGGQRKQSH